MTPERLYEVLAKYAESQGIRLNKDRESSILIVGCGRL